MTDAITFTVPIQTRNTANKREFWRATQQRAKKQKDAVLTVARAQFTLDDFAALVPCRVRLVRITPAVPRMDGDGLANSFKHVRDAVAELLGVDDGDTDAVAFTYAQEKQAKTNAVRVEIRRGLGAVAEWRALSETTRRQVMGAVIVAARGDPLTDRLSDEQLVLDVLEEVAA